MLPSVDKILFGIVKKQMIKKKTLTSWDLWPNGGHSTYMWGTLKTKKNNSNSFLMAVKASLRHIGL